MTENIYGKPIKENFFWTYTGTEGNPIKSPVTATGSYDSGKKTLTLDYPTENCSFTIHIIGIGLTDPEQKNFTEGKKIGTSLEEQISLKVSKTEGAQKVQEFFNQEGDCFKKKEQSKNSTSDESWRESSYNPYRVAAFPFDILKGSLSGLRKAMSGGLKEEIDRIKELLK